MGGHNAMMRMTVAAMCGLMLVGCGRETPSPEPAAALTAIEDDTTPDAATPASIDPLPALYSGVLPCADCPGIRYEIDLRPRNVFFLRMTYTGTTPERSYEDIGAWSLASDLRTLALRNSRQGPLLFSIADAATLLGAAKKQIDLQKEFTTSLMDSIERGVGQLVDADMNKESTRLQALQVQQQLGIQALSIANGNSQSILSLFRG